ncbi:MAG: hypothetical protein ACE5E5_03330 [Phycisphaerae bacterium]
MEDRRMGGLTGRSRKAHKRRRADRLQSQQLIDEYLSGDFEDQSLRHIPIRGRSEFLPTVASTMTSGPTDDNTQLELPLGDPSDRPTGWVAENDSESLLYTDVAPPPRRPAPKTAKEAGRPHRSAHFEMFEFSQRRKSDSFSMKRFLYGCLLGSGAAAAILLILQIAL